MKVLWSRSASDQVDEAVALIAAERPQAAPRWLELLLRRTKSLGAFPDQGRVVPELDRPDIRELLVPPYRVLYRRDENEVILLAVHHSRRLLDIGDMEP